MKKFHKITKDRVDMFIEGEIDVPTRTMWMGSMITDEGDELGTDATMAERVIKGLHLLDSQSHKPITILMNNIGGDEIHGMAIADAISLTESRIVIKVFGHAMSMGSIILQAADERCLAPTASVMIHYGSPMHADPDLHAMEQQTWSRECDKFRVRMENLYLNRMRSANPKLKLADVKQLLAYATIFDAQAAVKAGLADKVLPVRKAFKFA